MTESHHCCPMGLMSHTATVGSLGQTQPSQGQGLPRATSKGTPHEYPPPPKLLSVFCKSLFPKKP